MAGQLNGKVALITGGSSGIGQAAAVAFAREGAKVAIADVDVRGSEETLQKVKVLGGEIIFIKADVSKAPEVEAAINQVVSNYGRLDCAFNNAGISGELGPTAECSEENWDRIIAIDLKGVWLCMKYEILQMLKQRQGAIVNTASNFGLVGCEAQPAYTASKHGVVGLTKSAALEYAKAGIRVNAVCPGPTKTPLVDKVLAQRPDIANQLCERIMGMEPVGRWGMPEEIAEAVTWLCSDKASFVTGMAMPVDGGFVAQ